MRNHGRIHIARHAIDRAQDAVAELRERDAVDRAGRIERLTRWTAGDRETARAQEAAATNDR